MKANAVEPVDVIRRFKAQLLNGREDPFVGELCLERLEGRFSNRIVIRATFHAQPPAEREGFRNAVDQMVIELTAPIRVAYLDVKEVAANTGECRAYQDQRDAK